MVQNIFIMQQLVGWWRKKKLWITHGQSWPSKQHQAEEWGERKPQFLKGMHLNTRIVSSVVSCPPYCALGTHANESVAHVVTLDVALRIRMTIKLRVFSPTVTWNNHTNLHSKYVWLHAQEVSGCSSKFNAAAWQLFRRNHWDPVHTRTFCLLFVATGPCRNVVRFAQLTSRLDRSEVSRIFWENTAQRKAHFVWLRRSCSCRYPPPPPMDPNPLTPDNSFCNSAITKDIQVVCARIIVEMGSHLSARVSVQSHNSFFDQRSRKVIVWFHRNHFCTPAMWEPPCVHTCPSWLELDRQFGRSGPHPCSPPFVCWHIYLFVCFLLKLFNNFRLNNFRIRISRKGTNLCPQILLKCSRPKYLLQTCLSMSQRFFVL